MSHRAALPVDAVTITPGYHWRLDLDIQFDGQRPADWPEWIVRMHIWGNGVELSLVPGNGIEYEQVTELLDNNSAVIIPVIELTAQQTSSFKPGGGINYIIDIAAPGGVAEDYFAGYIHILTSPPQGLLS